MRRLLFLWLWTFSVLRADPEDLAETSPDGQWTSRAHWVSEGLGGYEWTLKNEKTGKIYFNDKAGPEEILPHNVTVLWGPNGHYAAVTFYYGRAMQDVVVVPLTRHPDLIDPFPNNTNTPLEKTLVHAEDLAAFTGYNRLLTAGDHWVNDTDLNISIDMLCFLKGGAAGQGATLSTTWHRTVHFSAGNPQVIDSVCDRYDKTPP